MSQAATRRRLCIYGRVQGVAFRAATVEAARRADVAGWVRNRPDGSVEAVLEGPARGVEEVERFCATGPPLARVERVERSSEAPEGLSDFEIR